MMATRFDIPTDLFNKSPFFPIMHRTTIEMKDALQIILELLET